MIVNFKKLNERAVMPIKGSEDAAGLDLTAIKKTEKYNELYGHLLYVEYDTGLAVEIPKGYVGLLCARSSVSNYNLDLANSVGVLDADFRGSIKFRFRTTGAGQFRNFEYKEGDRVGQLVIVPILNVEPKEVKELSSTIRNDGGYGSTGI